MSELHKAINDNNLEKVLSLLEIKDKVIVNELDQWGRSPLINAVISNENIALAVINSNLCDLNLAATDSGDTPMIKASSNFKLVKLLLEKGANPYLENLSSQNVLIKSCVFEDGFNTVKLLVGTGINVNKKDDKGNSAIYYALEHADTKMWEFLLPLTDVTSIEYSPPNIVNLHNNLLHLCIINNNQNAMKKICFKAQKENKITVLNEQLEELNHFKRYDKWADTFQHFQSIAQSFVLKENLENNLKDKTTKKSIKI